MSRLIAAAALALTISNAPASAEVPKGFYVLGDSSADLGSFGPDTRPTNAGQMWSERLAGRLGFSITNARNVTVDKSGAVVGIAKAGGASYALNGATALRFADSFSLGDQVDFLLQDRKTLGPDDLTFIWITRNDITSAFFDGMPFDRKGFTTAYIAQIDRLRAAGARNIVAFGAETDLLPTQFALDAGIPAEVLAQLKAETLASEAALWPELTKRGVYILDINKLAEDVRLNLKKYGFKAGVDSYQGRGDTSGTPSQARPNDGNVFTNDGHYTAQMQAVVADYVLAQLRARDQIASALTGASLALRGTQDRADAAIGEALARSGEDDHWHVSASAAGFDQSQKATTLTGPDLDGRGWALGFGAVKRSGDWAVGVRGEAEHATADFAQRSGKIDRTHYAVTAFGARDLGGGFAVDATATVGLVQLDNLERRASIGDTATLIAKGSTDGSYLAFGIGARYAHRFGAWRVEAGTGVTVDQTRLSAFSEDAGPLALSYGDQKLSSTVARLSLSVERTGDDHTRVRPFGSVTLKSDLDDDRLDVRVGPTKSTIVAYAPERFYRAGAQSELGVKFKVTPTTDVTLAATAASWTNSSQRSTDRRSAKRSTDTGVRLGITGGF